MAVTAPSAPVAPTPPTAPQVLFEGGGAVRESNVPVSKQQTDAERLESQARASVARGDGALAKTTQEKPADDVAKAQPAQGSSASAIAQDSGAGSAGNAAAQAANADTSAQAESAQQAQTLAPDARDASPAAHGALYWGAMLLAIAIVAGLIVRTVLHRRRGATVLTWRDINEETDSASGGGRANGNAGGSPRGETIADNLRGMTPDEALAELEREEREAAEAERRREHEEMLEARRAAKERLQAAGMPVRGAETPTATETAAREYRRELTRMVPQEPEKRAKPLPPLKPTKPRADGEESERFEVRI